VFAIVSTVFTGLNAQNNVISLPPYSYDLTTFSYQPLPAPGTPGGLGIPGFDYSALPSQFSHNIMQDASGNILFFIVDGVVYDKDGFHIGVLAGDQGTEITIMPDPGNCSRYYIIYAIEGITKPLSTSSNPYFSLLDLSNNSLQNWKMFCDVNDIGCVGAPTPINFFLTGITGGQWESMTLANGHTTFSATKLNSNNERFLYMYSVGRVIILKLDATGFTFIDIISLPNFGSSQLRGEMELIELPNGDYRLATITSQKPFTTEYGFAYADFSSTTGLPITPFTTFFYNDPQVFLRGLEFSPDGSKLFITHSTTPTFPAPIEEYVIGVSTSPSPVANIPISQGQDFQQSMIELGKDGKLYFATNNRLATYDLTTNTWNNNQLSITYNSNLGSGIFLNSASLYQTFILPDQIDGMDYTAHFTTTLVH